MFSFAVNVKKAERDNAAFDASLLDVIVENVTLIDMD